MIIGFQEDSTIKTQTGITRGVTVIIPKGTIVSSTRPGKKSYTTKKDLKVKVHHILSGQNVPVAWSDYRYAIKEYSQKQGAHSILGRDREDNLITREHYATAPLHNPEVVWAGSGGYWCQADINKVIVVK